MNRTLVAALAELDRDDLARHGGQEEARRKTKDTAAGIRTKRRSTQVSLQAMPGVTRAGRAWRAVTDGA